jgi:hypothetical protein
MTAIQTLTSPRATGWPRSAPEVDRRGLTPILPDGLERHRITLQLGNDSEGHYSSDLISTGLFKQRAPCRMEALQGLDAVALDADGADYLVHTGAFASTWLAKHAMQRMSAEDLDATLAPLRAEVLRVLETLGLGATRLACSGYGFHAWIWLDRAIMRDEAGFSAVQASAAMVADKAQKIAGYPIFDLAALDLGPRRLRPLHSWNKKAISREKWRMVRLSAMSTFRWAIKDVVAEVEAWPGYQPQTFAAGKDRKIKAGHAGGKARFEQKHVDFAEIKMPDGRDLLAWCSEVPSGRQRSFPAPQGRDGKSSLSCVKSADGSFFVTDFGRAVTLHHLPAAPAAVLAAAPTNCDDELAGLTPGEGAAEAREAKTPALSHGALWPASPTAEAQKFLPPARIIKVVEGADPGRETLEEEFAQEWGIKPEEIARAEVRELPAPEGFCTRGPTCHSASGGAVRSVGLPCGGYSCPVCGPQQLAAASAASCGILARLGSKGWCAARLPNYELDAAAKKALARWVEAAPEKRAWTAVPHASGSDVLLLAASYGEFPKAGARGPKSPLVDMIASSEVLDESDPAFAALAAWREVTPSMLGGRSILCRGSKNFRDLAAAVKRELIGLSREVARKAKNSGSSVLTTERGPEVAQRTAVMLQGALAVEEKARHGKAFTTWTVEGVPAEAALAAIDAQREGGKLTRPRRREAKTGLKLVDAESFGFDEVAV